MGVCVYSFGYRRPKSAYEFLEYCHELGAGGVQIGLDSLEHEYTQKVRSRGERLEMYLEVIADLPSEDPGGFERTVGAAKEAGALCLRAACLSGRRFETFSTLD
jgi:hypothetical protein